MATFCLSQGSRHLLRSNIKAIGRVLKQLLLHLLHDWSKFVDCHQRDSDKDREKHGAGAVELKEETGEENVRIFCIQGYGPSLRDTSVMLLTKGEFPVNVKRFST